MPFTSAQLLAEINTDPEHLGYAALVAAGSDSGIAALLNSLTGAGTGTVYLTVPIQNVLAQIQTTADWTLITTSGVLFNSVQLLVLMSPINFALGQFITLFSFIFASLSTASKTAMGAVTSRTGSRAEVLWGTGTVIGPNDVATALGR